MNNTSKQIRKGDVVCFKPEWQDAGDAELTFVAVEDQRQGGSVVVACTAHANWSVVPTQTVEGYMIARCSRGHDAMSCDLLPTDVVAQPTQAHADEGATLTCVRALGESDRQQAE